MTQFLLGVLLLLPFVTSAANLKGYVKESITNEPLVGATVQLKGTSIGTFVGLDGTFFLKDVPAGNYTLQVSFVGYTSVEQTVNVTGEKTISINFSLHEDVNQLNEVLVRGVADQESERSALTSEQNNDKVVNIIGAKSIQLLPDITVGNLLQRVSGVSITRNGSGDGQFAIIRGMDRRYNYTLVNGIKIPSPDDKNRYVPMDIFPSDLLERLEVSKALTPNMEGDAIGGGMNMIFKSAPEVLTITATASGGFSQIFGSKSFSGFGVEANQMKSPTEKQGNELYLAPPSDFSLKPVQYNNVNTPINSLFSFSIGNRVFNHKLGVFAGGSYQHSFRGNEVYFLTMNGQPSPDPSSNTPIFTDVQKRFNSNEQARIGSNIKLDYAITKNSKISLLGLLMQLEDWQHRSVQTTELLVALNGGWSDRSIYRKQNIYNATLQGDHNITDRLKLNWSGVYSLASSTRPAWTDISVTNTTAGDLFLGGVSQRWTHNEDRDLTGYLNLTYELTPAIELSTGGLYRDKDRSNYYNSYSFFSGLLANGNTPGSTTQPYSGPENVVLSFNGLQGNLGLASYTDAQNYKAKEQIAAGYIQGKITLRKLQIVGGVRMENTRISMDTQVPVTQPGRSIANNYTDILPSVHFKYSLTDKENLRLSYFKGISRPSFSELNPGLIQGDYFNESGNPRVKHITADNIDLRYELFPGGNSQLLIGTFYKNIQDPIEYGFQVISQVRTDYTPQNFGSATNYGFELVFSKFFQNFGVSGNYTYTQSSITTSKIVLKRDAAGGTISTQENQTRPLQGQSDHIGNLSFIYKSQKLGLNTQIAGVYTGSRITIVSPYKELDYWQRGNVQLDFSADKKFGKNFSLFVKATNLLNTPIIVELLKPNTLTNSAEQTSRETTVIQKDIFQQSYLIGVRYKY